KDYVVHGGLIGCLYMFGHLLSGVCHRCLPQASLWQTYIVFCRRYTVLSEVSGEMARASPSFHCMPAHTILPLCVLTPSLIRTTSLLLESAVRFRQSLMCLHMFFGLLHTA